MYNEWEGCDTVIYKYTSQLTPRPISTLSIICMITRCTSYSNCHFCFRQTVEYMMAYESHCQALSSSTTVNLYWLTFKLVGKWQWEKKWHIWSNFYDHAVPMQTPRGRGPLKILQLQFIFVFLENSCMLYVCVNTWLWLIIQILWFFPQTSILQVISKWSKEKKTTVSYFKSFK